uniref:SET domain-containing protein n=1 Tax=Rhizochromulina marina TaxID=1034831 RepID=A0A7S2WWE3_9STRA|mmetsp:Transcript_8388/g.23838  ORF Transcript_8388/g.23838 Transcript_8388/m.23838 type:complete len:491 (+) Transcript_8388:79-1551(+)
MQHPLWRLLLLLLLVTALPGTRGREREALRLLEWSQGYVSSGVAMERVSGGGVGVLSVQSLPQGHVVFRTPLESCLSYPRAKELMPSLGSLDTSLPEFAVMALFLAEARLVLDSSTAAGESAGWVKEVEEYVEWLPREATGVLGWTEAEVQEMLGGAAAEWLREDIRRRQDAALSVFHALGNYSAAPGLNSSVFLAYRRACLEEEGWDAPCIFDGEVVEDSPWRAQASMSFQALVWGLEMLQSRVHSVEVREKSSSEASWSSLKMLVPLADALNTGTPQEWNTQCYTEENGEYFTCSLSRGVRKGQELLVSYGGARSPLRNSQLFLDYGFALSRNDVPEDVFPFGSGGPSLSLPAIKGCLSSAEKTDGSEKWREKHCWWLPHRARIRDALAQIVHGMGETSLEEDVQALQAYLDVGEDDDKAFSSPGQHCSGPHCRGRRISALQVLIALKRSQLEALHLLRTDSASEREHEGGAGRGTPGEGRERAAEEL